MFYPFQAKRTFNLIRSVSVAFVLLFRPYPRSETMASVTSRQVTAPALAFHFFSLILNVCTHQSRKRRPTPQYDNRAIS